MTAGEGACVVCGGALEQPKDARTATVVRCLECGLKHTWPVPGRDVTSPGIFDESYGGQRLERRRQWEVEAEKRLDWVESIHQGGGALLEIGCATGEFVCAACRRGFQAVGYDSSTWAITHARRLCGATFSDVEVPSVSGGFDVVAMFHVIEHLPAPTDFMAEIRGHLGPEGLLFGELPHGASRHAIEDVVSWPGFEPEDHVAHYDEASLSRMLEDAGFVVLAIEQTSFTTYDALLPRLRRWKGWWKRGWLSGSSDLLRVVARPS